MNDRSEAEALKWIVNPRMVLVEGNWNGIEMDGFKKWVSNYNHDTDQPTFLPFLNYDRNEQRGRISFILGEYLKFLERIFI